MTKNMLFPLDSIFLRRAPNVEETRFSDHIGIRFDINTTENWRGNGYWKFNTSLLLDKTFCDELRKRIKDEHVEQNNLDPIQKWEHIKMTIRTYCSQYSKQKAMKSKKQIKFIEAQLKSIELAHHSEIDVLNKRKLEKELDDYYNEKCKAAYIRSRAILIEKGEKSTSYFLGLERKQKYDNTINRIKDNNYMS